MAMARRLSSVSRWMTALLDSVTWQIAPISPVMAQVFVMPVQAAGAPQSDAKLDQQLPPKRSGVFIESWLLLI